MSVLPNCGTEHDEENTLNTMIMIMVMSMYYAPLQVTMLRDDQHQYCNNDSVSSTDDATLLAICLRYNKTQDGY